MSEVISQKILVIDDEPDILELLDITLSRMGLQVTTAIDLTQAREKLKQEEFGFCLTDMKLPDGNGLDLVAEISQQHPDLPVAVLTAHGKVEDAVMALKLGAFDFVSKPVNINDLRRLVGIALKLSKPKPSATTNETVSAEMAQKLKALIGKSPAMDQVRRMTLKLARSQAPVFISGDSGTGKELVARLIHQLGPRSEENFIAVNCGAIPADLMESEFFGHVKGSFTGAHEDRPGLFQSANGGTLLVDEVADLPLAMQVKLLRVIQEKRVRAIGSDKEQAIDVRILSASHKTLKPLVDSGEFRNDLYFRLNVIELKTPALRERPEDIPLLVRHFSGQLAAELGIDKPPEFTPEASKALQDHGFHGNVRELVNILQRAMTLAEGQIDVADLMLDISGETLDTVLDSDEDGGETPNNLDHHLETIERRILKKALEECHYNKTETAKKLGLSFRSLRYKLSKYEIE